MSFKIAFAKIKDNEEIRTKSTPIAMVAPELKQNTEDTEITKTCAVLGCEESKNLNPDSFFRFPEDLSFRQIWTDLTGRNNWTPTDYSYICVQHFSVDCFECDANDSVVLISNAVPSLKLPKHVFEVEYIDEESLDNENEDDYNDEDEEDQDHDMENDVDNNLGYLHEEHLDEDELTDEFSPLQEQQNQHPPPQPYQLRSQKQQQTNKLQLQKHQQLIQPQGQNREQQLNKLQHQHQKQKPNQQLSDQLLQKKQEAQSDFKNVQQGIIKHLINGTPNIKINQPTMSKITELKNEVVSIRKEPIKTKEQENLEVVSIRKEPIKTKEQENLEVISIRKEPNKTKEQENLELLKLFTEVQVMQRQATTLKSKLRNGMSLYKRQSRCLDRLKRKIDINKNLLVQRRKKKSRILLSLQDKIKEDTSGLVLAMPTRHTDDFKNFALSIYKYSPQAYIYIRNTLRTLLPTTDILDSWLMSGYEPTNLITNSNMLRVVSELTDTELSCKVSLH